MWADPALLLPGQTVPEVCSKPRVLGLRPGSVPKAGRGDTTFECAWVTQPLVHPPVWCHRTLPSCHGRDGGGLGMPPALRKCLYSIYHPTGWPCSTQGAVAQPGRGALLHPLELFTCRALLQHLEVRAPGRSAAAFCTTKPWAAPLSCSPSPIINSFSSPTGFTCHHIPKKGRRSTQNLPPSVPKACPEPLRN